MSAKLLSSFDIQQFFKIFKFVTYGKNVNITYRRECCTQGMLTNINVWYTSHILMSSSLSKHKYFMNLISSVKYKFKLLITIDLFSLFNLRKERCLYKQKNASLMIYVEFEDSDHCRENNITC